jgi:putative redox protein
MSATPRKPNLVRATWNGEQRFDTARPDGPTARLDGTGKTGQSPPDVLLSALAACCGIDVADMLAKRRTPVEGLSIDVEGQRREEHPRRFTRIRVTFNVDGAGIETPHVERAITLALEKYCSVAASLASDIVLETVAVVNGATEPPVAHAIPT